MIVVSLKYSPVFSLHMVALHQACNELGITISFFCHTQYHPVLLEYGVSPTQLIAYSPNSRSLITEFFEQQWRTGLASIAECGKNCLILNAHPGNPRFLRDYLKTVKGKTFIWLHEPHRSFSELANYGLKRGLYYLTAYLFDRWSLQRSTRCFVASNYALKKFKPPLSRKVLLLPLHFPDLYIGERKKKYFSFVGHVNKGKGIDPFLELVEYCLTTQQSYQFLIVSSTLKEPWLSRAKELEGKNLKIISKSQVSDFEITESIAESYAVLCLYSTVTQSSVVASAMMQGTPVIATRTGSLPDAITEEKTGYFVTDPYDHAHLVKLMNRCLSASLSHQPLCRAEFQRTYSIDAIKPFILTMNNLEEI